MIMRQTSVNPSLAVAAFLAAALLVVGHPGSAAGANTTTPHNIIVIFADDLEWNDLPFFGNRPIQWDHEDDPEPQPPNDDKPFAQQPQLAEAEGRLPALNRLAARLYADRIGTTNEAQLGLYHGGAGEQFTVVPADIDFVQYAKPTVTTTTVPEDPGSFRYEIPSLGGCLETIPNTWETACKPAKDILAGFGGLARLAREGVTFPRFYTSSAVCAPTRGTLLTGRHVKRIDVHLFNDNLAGNEVTIAEFLKQGCQDPTTDVERLCVDWDGGVGDFEGDCRCYLRDDSADCANAACYTTGFIGKWHLGKKSGDTPWEQGFDEYIGFLGGARSYFTTSSIDCSPDTRRYCNDVTNKDKPCRDDDDCDSVAGSCSTKPGFALTPAKGLYIGSDPDAANVCEGNTAKVSVDCCRPLGTTKKPKAKYDFKKKVLPPPADEFARDDKDKWPCSDDGDTAQTGCVYYTRVIRDHAKNFIARHANGPEPFLLVVSFNAIHKPKHAPERTLAHYEQSGPIFKTKLLSYKYLAMLEELDAAIGEILKALDDPDGDGDGEPDDSIADDTVVFFTADQGQQRKHGNPNLFGGKGSVKEGGIRVGLLARAPDLFTNTGVVLADDRVGSIADLFPTIAHAAGYHALIGGDGRLTKRLTVCATKGNDCTSDTPCTAQQGAELCGRLLGGVSLFPVLKAEGEPQEFWQRDYAYAFYKRTDDKLAIATHEGYIHDEFCEADPDNCVYAWAVCGYESKIRRGTCDNGTTCGMGKNECASAGECSAACFGGNNPGAACTEGGSECLDGGVCGGLIRHVRGASCQPCVSDDQCDSDNAPLGCQILGMNVCVSTDNSSGPSEKDRCDDGDITTSCPIDKLQRCSKKKHCPSGKKCINISDVVVECNTCMTAAWKLRGTGSTRSLHDLTSNPEENELRNCYGSADTKILKVRDHLRDDLLDPWDTCVGDKTCNGDICEDGATCPLP